MAEEKELTGWDRSRAAQKGYGNFYAGLAIATVFIAGVWIGSRIFATSNDPNSTGFFLNLWTEALGILVTVGLFGLITQHLADNRYKRQLIDEVASTSNEIAKHAVHIMRRRGWIEGDSGLLKGGNFKYAALRGVHFNHANLQDSILSHVDLRDAKLSHANFKHADLNSANLDDQWIMNANFQHSRLDNLALNGTFLQNIDLSGAIMNGCKCKRSIFDIVQLNSANLSLVDSCDSEWYDVQARGSQFSGARMNDMLLVNCDFQNANLEHVKMTRSQLTNVNFRGANLTGVSFKEAEFSGVDFDENTVLPNGKYWTADADLERFTNPDHPNFEPFLDIPF